MALTETLTDNFNDNSLDTSKWFSYKGGSATVSETNQRIQLALPASATGSDYAGMTSNGTAMNFASSYVQIQLVQNVNAGTSLADFWLVVYDSATGGTSKNAFRWITESTLIYAQYFVNSVKTTLYYTTYNSTTHKWLRIRESSGTVYWDTSTDGLTWTNRTSAAPAISKSSIQVDIQVFARGPTTNPGSAYVDNFNILAKQVLPTGISSSEAFGTAQVGIDVSVLPTGISSSEAFGTANLLYDKEILPTGIDESVVSTPAVSVALLSSTVYSSITKPTTAHSAVVAQSITTGGIPMGMLLTLTYSSVDISKNTTSYSSITKPTTLYNGEVL